MPAPGANDGRNDSAARVRAVCGYHEMHYPGPNDSVLVKDGKEKER